MLDAMGIGRSTKETIGGGSAMLLPVTVEAAGFVCTGGGRKVFTGATAPMGAGRWGANRGNRSGEMAYRGWASRIGERISNATWLGTSIARLRSGGATKGLGRWRGVEASITSWGTRRSWRTSIVGGKS